LSLNPNEAPRRVENPLELSVPEAVPRSRKGMGKLERAYFKALIKKYGTDYAAMARDMKLNMQQYTPTYIENKCKIYIENYANKEDIEN
jgi:Lhr-like helicase